MAFILKILWPLKARTWTFSVPWANALARPEMVNLQTQHLHTQQGKQAKSMCTNCPDTESSRTKKERKQQPTKQQTQAPQGVQKKNLYSSCLELP